MMTPANSSVNLYDYVPQYLSFTALQHFQFPSKWLEIICNRYSETQRYYHNQSHITHLLNLYRSLTTSGKIKVCNEEVILWAILFHDVIYDPQKPDNESQSAQLFHEFAMEVKLKRHVTDLAQTFILATTTHSIPEATVTGQKLNSEEREDLKLFLDLDMEVLCWNREEYAKYSRQIRSEYIHVPNAQFQSGRSKVLVNFLTREKIYFLDFLRKDGEDGGLGWERKARENLEWEVNLLKTSLV